MTVTTHFERVRVWFGEHRLSEYDAESKRPNAYAEMTQRRFLGLTVTVDDAPLDEPGASLPYPSLWDLTVK